MSVCDSGGTFDDTGVAMPAMPAVNPPTKEFAEVKIMVGTPPAVGATVLTVAAVAVIGFGRPSWPTY
jgi:hypothetical protein